MVASVRKFSVEYNGQRMHIIYVVESTGGGAITYTGVNEQGIVCSGIPTGDVKNVKIDD
jgi:hypothetical protein